MDKHPSNHFSHRENFLLTLLNKITKEYKILVDYTRRSKPLKIVEIIEISNVPGETLFAIQLANKNCVLPLKVSEIINKNYDLNHFSDFHANMIREAAKGKLMEFLKLSDEIPAYKIVSKKFDKELQQYIFVVEKKDRSRFPRTAEELYKDKEVLLNLDIQDIYDIGFTQGSESILKEKAALLLAKSNHEKYLSPPK